MKKILLMMVALVATVSISAQDDEGWSKSFAPVSDKAELGGLCTAVAGDGSVYASSTYNQAFTFAGKAVADPDGLTSSCIVKYDKDGAEKWAISLVGKCKIYAMTADADGTLYVAGQSQDEKVVITDTQGHEKEIQNPKRLDPFFEEFVSANEGFFAKIDKDGVLQSILTLIPEVNPDILSIVGDPYGMGMEGPIYDYSFNDPVYVLPKKIVLDGDKVYVAAGFAGDIAELGWKGCYLNYFGMDETILDVKSLGIFSMDKNLLNLASVATVQATEKVQTMTQYYPATIDFVVYNGVPHVAFIGAGELTLATAAGSKNFAFDVTDDGLNHALVLANVNAPEQPKVFNAAPANYLGATYSLGDAAIAGDACILAGTFYGNFPLDNAITVDENAAFVASIDMKECTLNWRYIPNVHAEATCMIVTGEETHLATAEKKYTVKTADGKEKDIMEQGFADASSYNDQYCSTIFADDTNVCIFSPKLKPSNVQAAQDVQNGAVKVYTLEGIERPALQKGLNIIQTAEGTQKVLK